MQQLQEILTDGEMFILNLLINDVVLNVRLGNKIGKDIKTEVGICQGDCLSALLLIFYLAHAIKELPTHQARRSRCDCCCFYHTTCFIYIFFYIPKFRSILKSIGTHKQEQHCSKKKMCNLLNVHIPYYAAYRGIQDNEVLFCSHFSFQYKASTPII